MKFNFEFIGRKKGAQELRHPIKVEVNAESNIMAECMLFKHYEHISHLNRLGYLRERIEDHGTIGGE